jgi:hypothetical protein
MSLGAPTVLRQAVWLASALLALAFAVGCAEEEPRFGGPSAIRGKAIPGAGGGGGSTSSGEMPGEDDPFFPADAADPPAPRMTASAAHADAGQPEVTPSLACLPCHGPATAKPWSFGGYVRKKEADEPAAGAVVAVLRPDGKRVAAAADGEGYFWLPLEEGAVVAGTRTAVKDAAGRKAEMAAPFADGSCAGTSCHNEGFPIVVPK